jgi:hypothetical protein
MPYLQRHYGILLVCAPNALSDRGAVIIQRLGCDIDVFVPDNGIAMFLGLHEQVDEPPMLAAQIVARDSIFLQYFPIPHGYSASESLCREEALWKTICSNSLNMAH